MTNGNRFARGANTQVPEAGPGAPGAWVRYAVYGCLYFQTGDSHAENLRYRGDHDLMIFRLAQAAEDDGSQAP